MTALYWVLLCLNGVCIVVNSITTIQTSKVRANLEERIKKCSALIDEVDELRQQWFEKYMRVLSDGKQDEPS